MQTTTDELPNRMGVESRSTSSVWEQLLHNFRTGKEYRHAFVEEKVRTSIAAQIKAIREQQKLKQPEFAERLHKSQSWVSRLEDPNQAPPTIPSLLQVAEAFDVDLEVRFGRFSELLERLDRMTADSLEVPSFNEELSGLERKVAAQESKEAVAAASARRELLEKLVRVWVCNTTIGEAAFSLAGTGPISASAPTPEDVETQRATAPVLPEPPSADSQGNASVPEVPSVARQLPGYPAPVPIDEYRSRRLKHARQSRSSRRSSGSQLRPMQRKLYA